MNIAGQVAPLLAAAICIPKLIHHLGTERFGILTIAWMVIGYFSLFDLGLGRALTHAISEKLAKRQSQDIPAVAWTSLSLMLALGVFAGLLILSFRGVLTEKVLKIPAIYVEETSNVLCLLGLSLPFVITTTGLRGMLEAHQRFDLVNIVRVPMGIWTFAGPMLAIPWTSRLDTIVSILVAGRMFTTAWHAYLVSKAVPSLKANVHLDKAMVRPLIRFGGWMTISNVISPLMVYMDRFFISAVVGIGAVAYYTTPYEVVSKVSILPEAIFGVLFPLMTAQLASEQKTGTTLFSEGIKLMAAVMFPAAITLVMFTHPFLNWWLGERFAENSAVVMQLLVIGIFINSMAKVPFNLIQAKGRADLTAKIHMVELPIYITALLFALHHHGIVGAAMAWALRMLLDFILLTTVARRAVPLTRIELPCAVVATLIGTLCLVTQLQLTLATSMLLTASLLAIFAMLYFKVVLADDEKRMLAALVVRRAKA